ncbi:MAG: aspartate aminotransferase family protein [Halobacteriales archaeon]
MPPRETELNEIESMDRDHVFGTWSKQRSVFPTEITDTDGVRFRTADGNEYLDFASQTVCTNLGFSAERVADAVAETVRQTPFVKASYTTESRARLGRKLAEITPGSLNKTLFSTSGTEANEAAIKIAKAYTGKQKIMSRYRSYHGSTYGSISVTGDPRRWSFEPGVPGAIKAPDPYSYGSTLEPDQTLDYIDEMLTLEGDSVAAILVETIVGSNGVLVPPDDYLGRLKTIAHDHDALLICDEVMVGMGRTGEWFAVDHYDVTPDILTTAKGLSGAYVPLGATVVSEEVADHFEDETLVHGHTFSGHPVSCAAGLAAVETYQREEYIQRARKMGAYLGDRLRSLADRHPSVGDVRGLGLYWGLELTRHPEKRAPFARRRAKISEEQTVVDEVAEKAYREGVYIYSSMNTLMLTPPIPVTEDDVDQAIAALDTALDISDGQMEA